VFRVSRRGHPDENLVKEFKAEPNKILLASRGPPLDRAFQWLAWTPPASWLGRATVQRLFPKALPGCAVHARLRAFLEAEAFGLRPVSTTFATSTCPDAAALSRRGLEEVMRAYWGDSVPLGGFAGVPCRGGEAGARLADSAHESGGHLLLLFGPHLGVGEDGEVDVCKEVIGAYRACCGSSPPGEAAADGDEEAADSVEAERRWLRRQIEPHVARIQCQGNPMVALARTAYDIVSKEVDKFLEDADWGTGCLVLLGGLTLNMPAPCPDHFVPLRLEVHRQGEPAQDLRKLLET